MRILIHTFVVLFLTPVIAAEIRLGHGAAADAILSMAQKELSTNPSVKYKVHREGGLTGDSLLLLLDRGEIDLAIAPSSWETMKEIVTSNKLDLKNLTKMNTKVIGKNRTVIISSKDVPTQLSREQVKKLFTGQVENWKSMGGPDLPVTYILPANMRVTSEVISKQWLDGEKLRTRSPKELQTMGAVVAAVKSAHGAISFVSSATDLSGVNVYDSPVLDRPIIGIYMGEPKKEFEPIFSAIEKVTGGKAN